MMLQVTNAQRMGFFARALDVCGVYEFELTSSGRRLLSALEPVANTSYKINYT